MTNEIRRIETVYIDSVGRRATGTPQWFLEKCAEHPVSNNNELAFLICSEGFGDIAKKIASATSTIDLCCWGFDPAMELVRTGSTWPRGETFGDLLIAAVRKRNVKVRLLVWYDGIPTSPFTRNLPGFTHARIYAPMWSERDMLELSAERSLKIARERGLQGEDFARFARMHYCTMWWNVVRNNEIEGLAVRTRAGDEAKIKASLQGEKYQPRGLSDLELEKKGMTSLGTHHQKSILIDYEVDGGSRAVGYVMGLNSVTDYWDTPEHKLEDERRETGGKREKEEVVQVEPGEEAIAGFQTFKPFRDYACRITKGRALVDVHFNFLNAWNRANGDKKVLRPVEDEMPECLKRKRSGSSSVQIVRTQPDENDKTVKQIYFHATEAAAAATGYMYVENQYFQYQEWAEHLIVHRKRMMDQWRIGSIKAGKSKPQMPLMHVFIVMPVPERSQMIPRTYDILAVLGQQESMVGQSKKIQAEVQRGLKDGMGRPSGVVERINCDVVAHARQIEKPNLAQLEEMYGLRVAVAMLQTSGLDHRLRRRYREIYIHSKLLIVDDSFICLGSANLNQRSMAVDSELNMVTNDARHASAFRKRIFDQLYGEEFVFNCDDINLRNKGYSSWMDRMRKNRLRKYERKAMIGFLLPLFDNRSSLMRLG